MKEKYTKLVEELVTYRHEYYNLGESSISDEEYDAKVQQLILMETEDPSIIDPRSPTQTVGSTPVDKWTRKVNRVPMLSLDNVYDAVSTFDFFSNIAATLGIKPEELEIVSELKTDGLALSVIYQNGIFESARTRGDGLIGEDVTNIVQCIQSIPKRLDTLSPPEYIEVLAELHIWKHRFHEINARRVQLNEKPYATLRNAAAGSIRLQDPDEIRRRDLHLMPYGVGDCIPSLPYLLDDLKYPKSQQGMLKMLTKFGFANTCSITVACTPVSFEEDYAIKAKGRDNLSTDIDGIVYKVNLLRYQKELGCTARTPRWAIARKFTAQNGITTVSKVIFQVGRTGVITPVAMLRPIVINGVTITRANLYNPNALNMLGLCEEDSVLVERSGDVIPKITRVLSKLPNTYPVRFPTHCPSCNSKLVRDQQTAAIKCDNKLICKAQLVQSIRHYASKPLMNIRGLGKGIAHTLVGHGLLNNISDIYTLKDKLLLMQGIEGIGEVMATNLLEAIEVSKTTTLPKFIAALGIPGVGISNANDLAKVFKTFAEFSMGTNNAGLTQTDAYCCVENIGSGTAKAITAFFTNDANMQIINAILSAGVTMHSGVSSTVLQGTVWCITGTLTKPRVEYENIIVGCGGKVVRSISNEVTDILVGENAGTKATIAQTQGIPLTDEQTFYSRVNRNK